MDRTAEFRLVVANRRARSSAAPLPARPPITTRSEFTAEASQIGASIYATAEKLSKLTQLAQSKSLFEDPTAEISAMTGLIKTEITMLNAKLAELQGRMRQTRSRTKQRESHSSSVVESLSAQLRGATRDFQDVLQTRTTNMKLLQDRREQFSGAADGAGGLALRSHGSGRGGFGGAASSGAAGACTGGDAAGGAMFSGPGSSIPLTIFECPAAMQTPVGGSSLALDRTQAGSDHIIDMPAMLQTFEAQGSAYLESRASAVDTVQSTIDELGSIFEQLGALISEQGSNLNIIDDNVDDTLVNARQHASDQRRAPTPAASSALTVHAGREQLQRMMQRYGGNHALIMKIFAVLVFFVVLFGSIFA